MHHRYQRFAGLGQHRAALSLAAGEQFKPEHVLSVADLVADRTRGDMQLLGGARVTAMAGGRFQGAQGGDGGEVDRHLA